MTLASRECHKRVAGDTDSATNTTGVGRRDSSTTVLLIRHAHTDAIASHRLCGRLLGITLSGIGVLQAEELGRTLALACHLEAIYSSPLERAYHTAHAIARHQHAHVELCDALLEVDYGVWTGKTFEQLDADPRWRDFNRARAMASVPGGEQPTAVQQRAVAAVASLAAKHAGATIALVTHAEIVRFALLHYRSASLDCHHELEIAPASVSAVNISPDGVHVQFVNRCAAALRP
jgi:broad specificity phosphatase PhoE